MSERVRTLDQELHYVDLLVKLDEVQLILKNADLKQALIPKDWHRILTDMPVRPKKTKLTAAFDADMVRWFQGMGHGYQARMNAVLRAFMLAILSKEIESPGDRDWKGEQIWGRAAKKRPAAARR
jgi:hypothetical protein